MTKWNKLKIILQKDIEHNIKIQSQEIRPLWAKEYACYGLWVLSQMERIENKKKSGDKNDRQ